MLTINKLSKYFHQKKVVNNLSLLIPTSSIQVFLGESGVGKSTILRLVAGLEKPDSGTILYNDLPLQRKQVGMVFQEYHLFNHLTVLENITLALIHVQQQTIKQSEEIAHELLKKYGLAHKAHAYPAQLSGGQKQRIALARALALKPQIICLDEPTAALDPALTASIAQTIQELKSQGLTILISTHDTDFLKQLDCTIHLMEEGSIIQSGSTNDIISHPEDFEKIKSFTEGRTYVRTKPNEAE